MPLPKYYDAISHPTYKDAPLEEKRNLNARYWKAYGAENPDDEWGKQQMADSWASLDAQRDMEDAPPVMKRALELQRDAANTRVVGRNIDSAGAWKSQEERDTYFKEGEAALAPKREAIKKTFSLFTEDVDKSMQPAWTALQKTALEGGVFGERSLRASNMSGAMGNALAGQESQGAVTAREQYVGYRDTLAKDFNLMPEEVDDMVKHRMGLQETTVSRDAAGGLHLKPELLSKGSDEVLKEIDSSDLPTSTKSKLKDLAPLHMSAYKAGIIQQVKEKHPELAKRLQPNWNGNVDHDYNLIDYQLNQSMSDQASEGITGGLLRGVGGAVYAGSLFLDKALEPLGVENVPQEAALDTINAGKAMQSTQQLSKQIYGQSLQFLGVDVGDIGGVGYSVIESAAIGTATAGFGPAVVTADRIARAGKTGKTLLNAAQRMASVAPVGGLYGLQQGVDVLERGGSATDALIAGGTEMGVTMAFSGVKLGGQEDLGVLLANPETRKQVGKSVAKAWSELGLKSTLGVGGEALEEDTIYAINSMYVESKLNPGMTVSDFKKGLIETAKLSALAGGVAGTIGGAAEQGTNLFKPTYAQDLESVHAEADARYKAAAQENIPEAETAGGTVAPPSPERMAELRAEKEELTKNGSSPESRARLKEIEGEMRHGDVRDGGRAISKTGLERAAQSRMEELRRKRDGVAPVTMPDGTKLPGEFGAVLTWEERKTLKSLEKHLEGEGDLDHQALADEFNFVLKKPQKGAPPSEQFTREELAASIAKELAENPDITPERKADLQGTLEEVAEALGVEIVEAEAEDKAETPVAETSEKPTPRYTPLPTTQDRRKLEKDVETELDKEPDEVVRKRKRARLERLQQDHQNARMEHTKAYNAKDAFGVRSAEIELAQIEDQMRELAGIEQVHRGAPITEAEQTAQREFFAKRAVEIQAKLDAGEEITKSDRMDWDAAGKDPKLLPTNTNVQNTSPNKDVPTDSLPVDAPPPRQIRPPEKLRKVVKRKLMQDEQLTEDEQKAEDDERRWLEETEKLPADSPELLDDETFKVWSWSSGRRGLTNEGFTRKEQFAVDAIVELHQARLNRGEPEDAARILANARATTEASTDVDVIIKSGEKTGEPISKDEAQHLADVHKKENARVASGIAAMEANTKEYETKTNVQNQPQTTTAPPLQLPPVSTGTTAPSNTSTTGGDQKAAQPTEAEAEGEVASNGLTYVAKATTIKSTDPETGEKKDRPYQELRIKDPASNSEAFGELGEDGTFKLAGINARPAGDTPAERVGKVTGTKFFERAIRAAQEAGATSIEVNLQSADTRKVLPRLVEKGILTNPRQETGGSTDLHPTLFDISPTQETPSATEGSGESAPAAQARDTPKPEQMTPSERGMKGHEEVIADMENDVTLAKKGQTWGHSSGASYKNKTQAVKTTTEALERAKNPTSADITRGASDHLGEVNRAIQKQQPVSAEAVDAYGVNLPEGYVREGELYVYQPPITPQNPTPKAADDQPAAPAAPQKVTAAQIKAAAPQLTDEEVQYAAEFADLFNDIAAESVLEQAEEGGEVLYQGPQQPKGQIQFAIDMSKAWIKLNKSGDISTFAHEWAHFIRRFILNPDNAQALAAARRRGITDAELLTLSEWAGVKDGVWDRAAEEKFARAIEKYLREGKAPTAALQPLFDKFSEWLKQIYTSIKGSSLDIEITPEVQAIFDKLFAGSQADSAPAPASDFKPNWTTPDKPQKKPTRKLPPKVIGPRKAIMDEIAKEYDLGAVGAKPQGFTEEQLAKDALADIAKAKEFDALPADKQREAEEPPRVGPELVSYLLGNLELFADPKETMLLTYEAAKTVKEIESLRARMHKEESSIVEEDIEVKREYLRQVRDLLAYRGSQTGSALRAYRNIVNEQFEPEIMLSDYYGWQNSGKPKSEWVPVSKEKEAEIRKEAAEIKQALAERDAAEERERVAIGQKESLVIENLQLKAENAKLKARKTPVRKAPEVSSVRDRLAGFGFKRGEVLEQSPEDVLYQDAPLQPEHLSAFADLVTSLRAEGKTAAQIQRELDAYGVTEHTEAILSAADSKKPTRRSPEQLAAEIDPDKDLSPRMIYNMAGGLLQKGFRGKEMLNALLKLVQKNRPETTYNDVVDAYTGYGKTKFPSTAEITVLQRKEKRLALVNRQIFDIEQGQLAKLTGYQRGRLDPNDPDDQKLRHLIEERNQLMRDMKLTEDSLDKDRMRGTLSLIKTAYENDIADLQAAIDSGEAIAKKAKRDPQTDAELEALKKQKKAKQAEYNSVFGVDARKLTEEQRLAVAERALDRAIKEEEEMAVKGILERTKSAPLAKTPVMTAKAKKLADLRKARNDEKRRLAKEAKELLNPPKTEGQQNTESLEKQIQSAIDRAEYFLKHGETPPAKNEKTTYERETFPVNLFRIKEDLEAAIAYIKEDKRKTDSTQKEKKDLAVTQLEKLRDDLEEQISTKVWDAATTPKEVSERAQSLKETIKILRGIKERTQKLDPAWIQQSSEAWNITQQKKLERSIERFEHYLQHGKYPDKTPGVAYTKNEIVTELVRLNNDLKDTVTALQRQKRRSLPMSENRRKALIEALTETQRVLQKQLDTGIYTTPLEPNRTTDPVILNIRATNKALREAVTLLKKADPRWVEAQEQKRDEALTKAADKRAKKYEDMLSKGLFYPAEKMKHTPSTELDNARFKAHEAQRKWLEKRQQFNYDRAPASEKVTKFTQALWEIMGALNLGFDIAVGRQGLLPMLSNPALAKTWFTVLKNSTEEGEHTQYERLNDPKRSPVAFYMQKFKVTQYKLYSPHDHLKFGKEDIPRPELLAALHKFIKHNRWLRLIPGAATALSTPTGVLIRLERANRMAHNLLADAVAAQIIGKNRLSGSKEVTRSDAEQAANAAMVGVRRGSFRNEQMEKGFPLINLFFISGRYLTSGLQYGTGQPVWTARGGYRGTFKMRGRIAWNMYGRVLLSTQILAYTIGRAVYGDDEEKWKRYTNPLDNRFMVVTINGVDYNFLKAITPYVSIIAKLVMGYKVTDGKIVPLRGESAQWGRTIEDEVGVFLKNRRSLRLALVADSIKGEHYDGSEVTTWSIFKKVVTPINFANDLKILESEQVPAVQKALSLTAIHLSLDAQMQRAAKEKKEKAKKPPTLRKNALRP